MLYAQNKDAKIISRNELIRWVNELIMGNGRALLPPKGLSMLAVLRINRTFMEHMKERREERQREAEEEVEKAKQKARPHRH
jgi:hypothetical protein